MATQRRIPMYCNLVHLTAGIHAKGSNARTCLDLDHRGRAVDLDRSSQRSTHTTDWSSVKAADDQLLNRFLHRRPQHPRPKP